MGVVYKAKAHLKSPFDPENKRVKGIYDWDQTTHVKTDGKNTPATERHQRWRDLQPFVRAAVFVFCQIQVHLKCC